MPSRLSSLLVRDGLIGVRRMEQAFQRQVIYGGCLDTILLEMNLVPEERLIQYLALATGLPPATRAETEVIDLEAVKHCTADMAREFRVVPLCIQDGALRVLVHDPIDLTALEEFADQLGFPVQPLVVPEYRYHAVFGRIYERTPETRFAALAKRAEDASPVSPVGRARSVIIEQVPAPGTPAATAVDSAPAGASESASESASGDAPATDDAAGDGTPAPTATAPSIPTVPNPIRAARAARTTPPADAAAPPQPPADAPESDAPDSDAPDPGAPDPGAVAAPTTDAASAPAATADAAPSPHSAPVAASEPIPTSLPSGTSGSGASGQTSDVFDTIPDPRSGPVSKRHRAPGDLDPVPLSVVGARAAFAAAEERDLVFGILLRALRAKTSYAGLLTIQGGAAIGRIALVGDHTDHHDIAQVLIPLDEPSAFRSVVDTAAPHIGPIATHDPDINEMIERMGRIVPPAALLLPIVLRDRVVAVAVGHSGDELISIAEVSELLPLATDAADALSRIIVKAKERRGQAQARSGAARAPASPATAPAEAVDSGVPEPIADDSVEGSGNADPPSGRISMRTEVSLEADEPRTIEEILDAIDSEDDAVAAQAIAEAGERADDIIPHLDARFPGRLAVTRYELGGRVLSAAQHGRLLGLIVDLGEPAVASLLDKTRDADRDVRYYATLCLAEMRPRSALAALVERIFDTDYGIRAAAVTGLRSFPARELEQGLVRARQALHSDDDDRVQAAASALADLADAQSVPDLIEAQGKGGKTADHARRALVQLTKQSLGTSTRKWRAWWSKNEDRSRIEWLLDGLSHKDEAIRQSSVEDLRALTGEYFEYHYDLPKRDREPGRKRWLEWWTTTGRKRFLRADDADRAASR